MSKLKTAVANIKERRQKEVDLWHTWNTNGRTPEHLEPLLRSIEPLIVREVDKRLTGTAGNISSTAMKQNLRNSAVKSLKSFDPDRGAQLSTHIVNGFRRSSDFVAANRNIRSISRTESDQYKRFSNAVTDLQAHLEREPTAEEIRDDLGWKGRNSLKRVRNMQKAFASELHTGIDGVDITADNALAPHTAFSVVRSGLTPEQQEFGDHYFVENPQKIEAVAKSLGVSVHKARRIRAEIENRIKPILRNQ
jgi:hypothetical protein